MRRTPHRLLGLLLLMACCLGPGCTEDIPVAQYGSLLRQLDGRLMHGDAHDISVITVRLEQLHISWRHERLTPDPALLLALREQHPARARRLIAQILPGLDQADQGRLQPAVDHQALQRLSRSQQQQALSEHGELEGLPILHAELSDRTLSRLESMCAWLSARWDELRELLSRWFGHDVASPLKGGSGHLTLIVLIVIGVIAIGFGILALLQSWSTQTVAGAAASKAPGSDADPRSRASLEWQHYAEKLFAEGRWREAVRAWYHAVLVQCWTSGVIRHRPGWTNWEYASHLPSGWGSRTAFVDLTARFDRSWYGYLGGREEAETFAQHAASLYADLMAAPP